MRSLLLLLYFLALPLAAGPNATDSLAAKLSALHSLSGDFRQQLLSAAGEQLETSSGTFSLLRPGYLRWHITRPDQQLLLAAAGAFWHYDVELETATYRSLPTDSPVSPLAVLGADVTQLAALYQVEQSAPAEWRLLPRFENADFTALKLVFDAALPVSMTVYDPLERETRIHFENLRLNPPLQAQDFHFEPPPGVDIYRREAVQP